MHVSHYLVDKCAYLQETCKNEDMQACRYVDEQACNF